MVDIRNDGALPDLPAVVNFGTGEAEDSFKRLAAFRPFEIGLLPDVRSIDRVRRTIELLLHLLLLGEPAAAILTELFVLGHGALLVMILRMYG